MRQWLALLLIFCLTATTISAQTATPTPTPEPDEDEIIVDFYFEPVDGQEIDPPLTIELPDDWLSINSTVVVQDIFGLQVVPFTLYVGPVSDGDGFIVVLWGYESTGVLTTFDTGEVNFNPYLDALRLLGLAVIGTDCVPGIDVERDFTVGDVDVRGAYFAAYRCEETVDTRGWFVGLEIDGLNMGIYIYTEPIEAMDGDAPDELQAILDTIVFDVAGLRERLPEIMEQREAIILTLTPIPTATPTPTVTP